MRGRLLPQVRPFGRLLTSYTLNEIGDAAGVVALSVLVFDRTHEVSATAALFVIAKFLPALLAPPLTARIDRLPLRRVLPTIYVVEAAIFAVFALMAHTGFHLAAVLALALVDGCLALTGRGLTRGAVAQILKPADRLREGNALMNVGFAFSCFGGAALAGLLIGGFGLSAALLTDAGSFLAIAVILATTAGLPQVRMDDASWVERLRAGLSYARSHRMIRLLLTGEALALVCFTMVAPVEVVYAKQTLETTSAGYAAFVACWGVGIVVGSAIYMAVRRRSPLALIFSSSVAIGAAYLGIAATSEFVLACGFAVIGGAGNGVQWVSVVTALQEATPIDLQARISGLLESIGAAVPGVGYVLGGLIAAVGSPQTTYAVAGAGVMALVVIGLVIVATSREARERPSAAQM